MLTFKPEIRLYALKVKLISFLKDFFITFLMLGLLISFTKLIKFIVLVYQEFVMLNEQFSYEKETINRTSHYIINTPNVRKWETSFELNNQAESLSNQVQGSQILLFLVAIFSLLSLIILYFSIDFLLEYTNKFKPWSIVFLMLAFLISVLYIEITDLKETGNCFCFMFTTIISLISGMVLIGYTLIFPNYRNENR
ncbi:MAG: hypothetical protein ACOYMA_02080 [Bacteroidia bacterium]